MSLPEIVFVALSLSLDAAIVAVSAGATGRATPGKALLIALVFGGFQALMPLLGWGAGSLAKDYLLAYGRVIGFALIFLVGAKMLKEGLSPDEGGEKKDLLAFWTLLMLGIATSIDALVIGVAFTVLPTPVPLAVSVIGVITFVMALLGVFLGKSVERFAGGKAELLGGAVLILLAFKTLLS